MKRFLILIAILHSSFCILHSQTPNVISYQGRIVVGSTNFDGTGQFKFAILSTPGSFFWSNDGTGLGFGVEPTSAVTLTVTKGLYSVLLGDTTLPNMTVIPNDLLQGFGTQEFYLRVWFNDGVNGFQLLTPDQRITPAAFAMMAGGLSLPVTESYNGVSIPSSGVIKQNGATILHTAGGGDNFFIGRGAAGSTLFLTGSHPANQRNTAVGSFALAGNTDGGSNIALGFGAGQNITSGSNNIDIGNSGLASESGIIRIGTDGTHTDTYLAGVIHGDGSALTNLSGGSLAAGSVTSTQLASGAVQTINIASQAVGTNQIAGSAITGPKIADGSINSTKLTNNAVQTGNIAGGAVDTAQITDGAVTTAKINDGAVSTTKIANNAVTAAQIAGGAIMTTHIAADAVGSGKIADGSVLTAKINDGAVTSAKISTGAVGALKLADGAVTAAKLGADVGLWSAGGADVFRTTGNVGIGASEPIVSLAHPNSLLPGQKIYDGTTRGLHVDGGDKGIVAIEADNWATLHLRSFNASDDNREFVIRHDSSGQVTFAYPFGGGITEAPVMKMLPYAVNMFANNVGGCTLRVGDNSGGTASVIVRNTLSVDDGQQTPAGGYFGVNFGGATSGEFITSNRTAGSTNRLGLDLYTASQPRLSITAGGNVGIGSATPTQARLVVSGNGGTTLPAGTYGYLTPSGASGNAGSNFVALSIYATEGIWTSGNFYASSDARIKSIIGLSDGAKDMTALMGIQVTDYHYKDMPARGRGRQKKVIAQQLEKVFPQAVSRQTDVVPDIFQKAVFKDGWLLLKTSLKEGERVRLTDDKTTGVHEVLEVRDGAFRTGFQPEGGEVFVYGREVKDFRVVDYEAIAMLNVSATQEIARKVETGAAEIARLKAEIATKDTEITALKQQLTDHAARDKAIEARLAALEQSTPPASARAVKVALRK